MTAEEVIPQLEEAWMQAWVREDSETCRSIIADDFLLTSARGILMSKTDWLSALASFKCTVFAWEKLTVRSFGDTAIVHGRARQQAAVAGQDWSGLFLISDVWVRRHDQWQVVARHGTGPVQE